MQGGCGSGHTPPISGLGAGGQIRSQIRLKILLRGQLKLSPTFFGQPEKRKEESIINLREWRDGVLIWGRAEPLGVPGLIREWTLRGANLPVLRRRFQNNSQGRRSRRHRARGSGQARCDCRIWTWPDACGAQWRGCGLRPHCPAWIRAKRYMMLMAWRCQPEWRGHRWGPQMLTQSLHVGAPPPPSSSKRLPGPSACQLFRAQTDNPKILKAVPQQLGVAGALPTASAASWQFLSYSLSLSRKSASSDEQNQCSMASGGKQLRPNVT